MRSATIPRRRPPRPRATVPDGRAAGPPRGPGSVDDCRGRHDDVVARFRSRWVDVRGVRLHAVVGGGGPPLLLLAGWPQTWFAWRLVLARLARWHTVVALDSRGQGLSEKPSEGYDTGGLAADAAAVMDELGHDRFAVVGHDVGMWVGYALAADEPHRVTRLAVAEATVPGLLPSPPLFAPQDVAERLWHFGFNRAHGLPEVLVAGRERAFVGYQCTSKAARPLPAEAVEVYARALASGPDALRASFGPYRELDATMAQNARRRATPLTVPVLTVAGDRSSGSLVEETMRAVATDVRSLVLADCGHFPAEECPEQTAEALVAFLSATDPAPRGVAT